MNVGASLYEFPDRDLLAKLEAEADNEGWVESRHLAEAVGLGENGGTHAMGQRLSWMRRFGMLEFDHERRMWRLTDGARRVNEAGRRAAYTSAIAAVPDEAMVEVMAAVTTRYMHGAPMMAHMLRREFQYGTKPR